MLLISIFFLFRIEKKENKTKKTEKIMNFKCSNFKLKICTVNYVMQNRSLLFALDRSD